jgi:hypothetical protein
LPTEREEAREKETVLITGKTGDVKPCDVPE